MSKIEWTERTWNPVVGCTPVSPGCLNCYAATLAPRLAAMGQARYADLTVRMTDAHRNTRAVFNGTVRCVEDALTVPLARKKPTVYFVCSMGDLFHESVPDAFIDRVFAVMALCRQHTFQVLTKRSERMADYFADQVQRCDSVSGEMKMLDGSWPDLPAWPLPNVWLGTSAEDQTRLDERVGHLLRCPAAVRFLSCEPLLGALDLLIDGELSAWACPDCGSRSVDSEGGMGGDDVHTWYCPACDSMGTGGDADWKPLIDWVIVGGESGAHARPCFTEWVRSVVRQCKDAGVPVFVKQLGKNPCCMPEDGGFDMALRDRKGGDWDEWPEDLRVRETPALRTSVSSVPSVVDR